MLHQILIAVEEILAEMGAEVVHAPLRLALEIVQFIALVGIAWMVAIGFGKRRGFVANMLSERFDDVGAHLELASHSAEDLAHAKQLAALKARAANAEARRVMAEAKREAEAAEAQARTEADAEAARITSRAESALSTEDAEMHMELREMLVDLVAQSTRSIMNEKMSVAEQRKLIEDTIVSGVGRAKSRASDGTRKRAGVVVKAGEA